MITILIILGGLGLFMFGVRMLSRGMEQLAGSKLQKWLDVATNKPLKGAAFGAVATALLQSSSLLMATMIGLINGNLLTLEQSVGVILGTEIGTTVTGQLVAFKIDDIRFLAIAAGFVMIEFGKERKWRSYGQILLGFGLLFSGMSTMEDALKPLAAQPNVGDWMARMGQQPLLGVLGGTLLTGAIFSSSATTGLVIAMGASGLITLPGAIGIVLGANIGTCFDSYLAAARGTTSARRAAVAQIIINLLGVLIFAPFIIPYASLLERTAASLPRQIANAHTIFNVAVSAILFPFVRPIVKLTGVFFREKLEVRPPKVTRFIDDHLRSVPSIAIEEAAKELDHLGSTALEMLELSQKALFDGEEALEAAEEVVQMERQVADPLCDAIERFVDGVIAEELDSTERKRCFQLKNTNTDLERVADHAENMAEAAQDRYNHQVPFSDVAIRDLRRAFDHANRILEAALAAFRADDKDLALLTCSLEDEMDHIEFEAREAHMMRMATGECHPEAGVLFVETLRNLERIGDHADNIALSVLRKS